MDSDQSFLEELSDWSGSSSENEKDSSAINRHSHITHSGQCTLDGGTVYEEVKESVSFSKTHHELDKSNLNTIIYPSNLEVRKYQEEIVRKAVMENVLCSLPTGLGKTFIAATVMLNFYRWVARAKIIFMAPTRPLVAQQMRACYGIAGLPLEDTAVLVGVTRKDRAILWETRRVFFSTPQMVANDLLSGLVDPRNVCCIVVDEAHRARGGSYAYCKVIERLDKFNTSFRVLALTATPGATIESVQTVVDNLDISSIQLRTDKDPDVLQYMNSRSLVEVDCEVTPEIQHAVTLISEAILPVLKRANSAGIYDITDPARINQFMAVEKSRAVVANHRLPEGLKWTYFFILRLLSEVGNFFRRLNVYGIVTFYSFFLNKYTEFTTKYQMKKSTNKLAASFYFSSQINELKNYVEHLMVEDTKKAMNSSLNVVAGAFSHTKFQELVKRVTDFLHMKELNNQGNSSIIVFTEFRDNALEIVRCLESANKLIPRTDSSIGDLVRPHIFIGQAKEKSRFDEKAFRSSKGRKKKCSKKKKSNEKDSASPVATRLGSSENAQAKGMSQKDQKALLTKFKAGIYNVLVATSIGEEGLDIGEVDMIVCFDSTSSPIKNIQRMGRTGRKRAGNVVMLFSSNERDKFSRAMDNYRWIQNKIRSDDNIIDLHASDRIIPKECKPRLVFKTISIPETNKNLLNENDGDDDAFMEEAASATSVRKSKAKRNKRSRKRKKAKNDNGGDNRQMKLTKKMFIPDNAKTGFRPASTMIRKAVSKKQKQENAILGKKKELELEKPDETLLSNEDEHNELTPSQLFSSSLGNTDAKKKDKTNEPVLIDLSQFTDDELKGDEQGDKLCDNEDFDSLKVDTKLKTQSENDHFFDMLDDKKDAHAKVQEQEIGQRKEAESAGDEPVINEIDSKFLFGDEDIADISTISDSEGGRSTMEEKNDTVLSLPSNVVSDLSDLPASEDQIGKTKDAISTDDTVFDLNFKGRDGFMSSKDEMEFYSKYFTDDENLYYDPRRFNVIDDPLICIKKGGFKLGNVPHSSASDMMIEWYKTIQKK